MVAVEQVGFDGGGDDRAFPFEQSRDGEAGGLAAPGRADDGEAVAGSGGDQAVADVPRMRRPRRGRVTSQVGEFSRAGRVRRPVGREAGDPGGPSASVAQHEHDREADRGDDDDLRGPVEHWAG